MMLIRGFQKMWLRRRWRAIGATAARDATEIATEGPPLDNTDEPLGELVPVVDEDPPLG